MYQQKGVGQARMMKIGENEVGRKSSTTRSTFGRRTKRRGKLEVVGGFLFLFLEVVGGCMCLKRCCHISSGAPHNGAPIITWHLPPHDLPTLISGALPLGTPHIFDILVMNSH
jgi:hypothetical protein